MGTYKIRGRAGPMLAFLALFTTSSCVGGLAQRNDPFAGGPDAGVGQIRVEVRNLNSNDASFFAIRKGDRIRLGSIPGNSEGDFMLDWHFSLPLQFEAHMLGAFGCRAREITADPGDQLWVQIPALMAGTPCRVGKVGQAG